MVWVIHRELLCFFDYFISLFIFNCFLFCWRVLELAVSVLKIAPLLVSNVELVFRVEVSTRNAIHRRFKLRTSWNSTFYQRGRKGTLKIEQKRAEWKGVFFTARTFILVKKKTLKNYQLNNHQTNLTHFNKILG